MWVCVCVRVDVSVCMCRGGCETVSVCVHSLLMFFSNVFIKIEIGVEIHKEKFNPWCFRNEILILVCLKLLRAKNT